MDLAEITPLILTYNEAANIGRCLSRLTWAKRVVVLDSFSTDATASIVATFPNAVFVQRRFDVLATQWNFGIQECGIATPWVLGLDADYLVPPEFVEEVRNLKPRDELSAFKANFVYCVYGRRLRCGSYPPVSVLFRREKCIITQDGHAHRLKILQGVGGELATTMEHDDRKSIAHWIESQSKYADLEAKKLVGTNSTARMGYADRARSKVFFAPFLSFAYFYFYRGGYKDGWAGWYYVCQRVVFEMVLSLKLLEAKWNTTVSLPGSGERSLQKEAG